MQVRTLRCEGLAALTLIPRPPNPMRVELQSLVRHSSSMVSLVDQIGHLLRSVLRESCTRSWDLNAKAKKWNEHKKPLMLNCPDDLKRQTTQPTLELDPLFRVLAEASVKRCDEHPCGVKQGRPDLERLQLLKASETTVAASPGPK